MANEEHIEDSEQAEEELIEEENQTATATKEAPKKTPKRTSPKSLPPYKVLLHNDDINTVDHVIMSVMRLTPLQLHKAIECTKEAHFKGLSLLLITHKERAELYQEQFKSMGLKVTIEPDTP